MVCIPVGLLPAFTTQGIDMHYYKRNLGDYAKKAGRLSLLQHGSYTVLIDSCYDREQFPTLEQAIEWTWADSVEEIEAVKFVLRKFFILEDGIYVQNRIREEIAEYHEKASINKQIAINRETKRKESNTNRERTVDEASPNQEPLTKNQEPLTKNQEPLTINKIHTHLSMLLSAGVEHQIAKDWLSIRKTKRLPLTETAFNAISKKILSAGLTINAGIKICVENGWAGFSSDWLTTVPELKTVGPYVHWWDTKEATHQKARKEGVEIIDDLGTLRERINDVIQSKKQRD